MEKRNWLIVKIFIVLEKMGTTDVPVCVSYTDKQESTLRESHKL